MPSKKGLSARKQWTNEAMKLPDDKLRLTLPVSVVFDEAADVARFYKANYRGVAGKDGGAGHAGFESVVDPERGLGPETGEELLSLREVAQQVHTEYVLAATREGVAPMARGRFIVGEIASTLRWYVGDAKGALAAQLARITAAYARAPASMDALAQVLENHAAVAAPHRKAIDGLGGFDAKLIDEALVLARELRARPAVPLRVSNEAKAPMALRNRLVVLLWKRMGVVRAAARFVFRRHPELLREVTSAYERRRRAAAREGKVDQEKEEGKKEKKEKARAKKEKSSATGEPPKKP